MINTVFYFPSSIDEYNAATVDPRTICFVPNANGNGSIYKGGKKFGGADISDVITAIQQYMEQHPAHDYSADVESLLNDITAMSATLRGLSSINKEGIQTMFKKGFATYKEMIESFESTGDQTYKDYTFGKEDFEEWASEMGIVVPQGNGYYQVGWSRLSLNVSEIRASVTQIGHTVNNLALNSGGEVNIEQLSANLYAYIHDNASDAGISSTWGRYIEDGADIQLLRSMASTILTYANNSVSFAQLMSAADDYRTGSGALANIYTKSEVDGAISTATAGMIATNNLGSTVASIIAAINANLESSVTISADKIDLDGYTFVDNITAEYYDTDTVKVYDTTNNVITNTDWIDPQTNSTEEYTSRYTKTKLDVDGINVSTRYNNRYANGANGAPSDHYTSYNGLLTSDSLNFHKMVPGESVSTGVGINANTENGPIGIVIYDNHVNTSEPKTVQISPTLISVTGDINADGVVHTHTISHSVGIDDANVTKDLTIRCSVAELSDTYTSEIVLSGDNNGSTISADADYVNVTTNEDVTITSSGHTNIAADCINTNVVDELKLTSLNKIKLTAPTIESGNVNVSNGTYSTEYAADGITSTTGFSISSGINQAVMIPSSLTLGGNVSMTGSGKLTINTTGDIELGSSLHGEPDIYIYATPTGGSTPAKYKLNLQKLIQDGYLVAV